VAQRVDLIPLADAAEAYRAETGFASAYTTLRGHAARTGSVYLGAEVRVHKAGGRWAVSRTDLDRGLRAERQRRAGRVAMADDYEHHILHGRDGARFDTTWGYYTRRGPFHFAHHSHVPRWDTDGTWYCSTCWSMASREHDKPECHRCADWNGCGTDCTLSALRCDTCNRRMEV